MRHHVFLCPPVAPCIKPPPAIICDADQASRASLPPLHAVPVLRGFCCCKKSLFPSIGTADRGLQPMMSCTPTEALTVCLRIRNLCSSAHLQRPRVANRVTVAGSDQPRRTLHCAMYAPTAMITSAIAAAAAMSICASLRWLLACTLRADYQRVAADGR